MPMTREEYTRVIDIVARKLSWDNDDPRVKMLKKADGLLFSKEDTTEKSIKDNMLGITNLVVFKSNPKLKMTPDGDFFRLWVDCLRPLHKLTKREMDVLAEFLKMRYNLGKVIIDTDTLDRVLMDGNTKGSIANICGINRKYLNVILEKFKKNGVLKNNRIPLNMIPTITEEGVGLMIHFDFKDEQHAELGNKKSVQKT